MTKEDINRKLKAIDDGFLDVFLSELNDYIVNLGEGSYTVIGKDIPASIVEDLRILTVAEYKETENERKKSLYPGYTGSEIIKEGDETLIYKHILEQGAELVVDYLSGPTDRDREQETKDRIASLPSNIKNKYSLSTFYTYPDNYCHRKDGDVRKEAMQIIEAAQYCSIKLYSAEYFSKEEYGDALNAFYEKMNKILKYCGEKHGIWNGISNAQKSVGNLFTSRDKAKAVTKTEEQWAEESRNIGIEDQNALDAIIEEINKATKEGKEALKEAAKYFGGSFVTSLTYYNELTFRELEKSIKKIRPLLSQRYEIIKILRNKHKAVFSDEDFDRIKKSYLKNQDEDVSVNFRILEMCCEINSTTLDDKEMEYLKTINVLPKTVEKMKNVVPIVMKYRNDIKDKYATETKIDEVQYADRSYVAGKIWDQEKKEYDKLYKDYEKEYEIVTEYNEKNKSPSTWGFDTSQELPVQTQLRDLPVMPTRDNYIAYNYKNKSLDDYIKSVKERKEEEKKKLDELKKEIDNCEKEFQRIRTSTDPVASDSAAGGTRRNHKRMLYSRRGRKSRRKHTRRHRHRRTIRK